jgi:beta-lactamase superfamily II metal-dependent hydrolase
LIDSGFNPNKNSTGGYHRAFWQAFKASGATHRTGLYSGALMNWDPELTVKVCGPKAPFWTLADAGKDPERFYNENSLVLWMKHGAVSYLFTGDITPPAQNYLCHSAAEQLKATTIFSVPHHGKYYLDKQFAAMVGSDYPSLRFGIASENHTQKGPRADRVSAWRQNNITILTGDGNNDITITSSGEKDFEIETTNPPKTETRRVR